MKGEEQTRISDMCTAGDEDDDDGNDDDENDDDIADDDNNDDEDESEARMGSKTPEQLTPK